MTRKSHDTSMQNEKTNLTCVKLLKTLIEIFVLHLREFLITASDWHSLKIACLMVSFETGSTCPNR